MKNLVFVLGAILTLSLSGTVAFAQQFNSLANYGEYRGRTQNSDRNNNNRNNGNSGRGSQYGGRSNDGLVLGGGSSSSGPVLGGSGDQNVVNAVNGRRNLNFIEGAGMIVVKIEPDDNQGLQHQIFYVRLSSNAVIKIVYNLDMGCARVPIKMGDAVAVGGEFKMITGGGMLHWTHFDPRHQRPDGYVQLNGVTYCRGGNLH